MKITKIMFSKTFPVAGIYYEKIFLEAEIIEGDDIRNCLYDLKRQVENFFYESTKAAEKQMGTKVVVSNEKTDLEFQELKEKLNSFEYKEDAQAYLDTTEFRLMIPAKNIINSKKSKNEKK